MKKKIKVADLPVDKKGKGGKAKDVKGGISSEPVYNKPRPRPR
jgi:hypothetical protein